MYVYLGLRGMITSHYGHGCIVRSTITCSSLHGYPKPITCKLTSSHLRYIHNLAEKKHFESETQQILLKNTNAEQF